MKKSFTDKVIITSLLENYQINVINLKMLPIGADENATVYQAKSDDHKKYFVKLKQGNHGISVTLQSLLHHAGIKEILAPLKTLNDESSLQIDDYTLMVYPFVTGHDGFNQNLTDEQWIIFGKTLRQVHQFKIPDSMASLIPHEFFCDKYSKQLHAIFENQDQIHARNDIELRFLTSLKKHQLSLLALADRAEQLSKSINPEKLERVFCHGDIHAGNVLISQTGNLYIVDWDQPIIAPKERDLMFIGGGVGNVWNKQRETELFYTGYGQVIIDQTLIDYYRCERIMQDIIVYHQLFFASHVDDQHKITSYHQFIAMFEPNGVVEIALQSYSQR